MNAYAINQAYTEASVMTATPERLIVMLYDGAARFLAQGAAAMRADQLELCRSRLDRAQAIIDELNVSLDMEQGEVASRLRAIYLFCKRRLIEATVQREPGYVDEVAELLGELRESWDALASQAQAELQTA